MVSICATITHGWRSSTIFDVEKCNVYKQWRHSTRQLRTDGGPTPFLKLNNRTLTGKTRHFSAPQTKQAKIYLRSVSDLTDICVTKR